MIQVLDQKVAEVSQAQHARVAGPDVEAAEVARERAGLRLREALAEKRRQRHCARAGARSPRRGRASRWAKAALPASARLEEDAAGVVMAGCLFFRLLMRCASAPLLYGETRPRLLAIERRHPFHRGLKIAGHEIP